MRVLSALGLAVVLTLFPPNWCNASVLLRYVKTPTMPTIISSKPPPQAIVDFVARNPAFATELNAAKGKKVLKYDDHLVAVLEQVQAEGNKIKWTDDRVTWGKDEVWEFPCEKDGHMYEDCDGITLWKMRRLMELGLPSTPLLPTGVFTETDEGHLVLVVVTDKGEFVLDNRRPKVMAATDLIAQGYLFDDRPVRGDRITKDWIHFQPSRVMVQHSSVRRPAVPSVPLCTLKSPPITPQSTSPNRP